jgi:hypothetical protein
MTLNSLPEGAYLAWQYVDGHRAIDRGQVYWDDGRIEAIEGEEHEELCRLSAEQAEAARHAIVESGLPGAAGRSAGDAHDTATVTYWWRAGGREGTITNAGYPVERPPEVERLEARLADLEEAAGCWPLLADE